MMLGEGFSAKSIQIPRVPVHIPLIRQHFIQHKSSSHHDLTDILMPVSDRLFGRPMRIVYDTGIANRLQPNTFATRDACSLQTGFGPFITGQVSKQEMRMPSAELRLLCHHVHARHRTLTLTLAVDPLSPPHLTRTSFISLTNDVMQRCL